MGEVAAEYEKITGPELDRHPFLAGLPLLANCAAFGKLDIHPVATRHDFHATVGNRCCVDCDIGGRMLNLANVIIRWRIKMSAEAIAAGKLVVDLVLEEKHLVSCDLTQDIGQVFTV